MTLHDVDKAIKDFPEYLIPREFEAKKELKVIYAPLGEVNLGNDLPVHETQHKPAVEFDAKEDEHYVIALMDPDAPSRDDTKWAPFAHWIRVHHTVKDKLEYFGPRPPSGSGLHRYTFLLYKAESKEIDIGVPGHDLEQRKCYKIEKFVKDNKLELIGVNFFRAEEK